MKQNHSLPVRLQSLCEPATYPHPADNIVLHETHISWVFLAGEYAYKIKKPVNLGFVDFTTLSRRQFFCEQELKLNRRLAPELYLAVQPFREISGKLAFMNAADSAEAAVEFAVQMQRFPETALLTHPAALTRLNSGHLRQLACDLAEFHRTAEVAPAESPWGTPDSLQEIVQDNFTTLRKIELSASLEQELNQIEHWVNQTCQKLQQPFRERIKQNRIREGHGDLHLNNMVLLQEKICVFDCIEFNEDFRWGDPIHDVAFLTMDLHDHDRPELAHLFFSDYLEQSGDYEGAGLLPFYQVCRALVRAKVAAIRELQLEAAEASARQQTRTELEQYLHLANRFRNRTPLQLTLMCGVSGTGKSGHARTRVADTGAVCLRSDWERKRIYQECSTGKNLPADPYSMAGIEAVYQHLASLTRQLLQAGQSVVVDATFITQAQRKRFLDLAEETGAEPMILYLDAEDSVLQERIRKRALEAGNISDATAQVLHLQRQQWEPFTATEQAFVYKVPQKAPQFPLQDS